MDKGKINLPFRKHFGGILQKLFYAVLDEQKRYEAIPTKFPPKSKEELQKQKHLLPAPIEAFYVKSIGTLNEIGKSYPAQSAEEVFLCKKLAEYNKIEFEEDFIEGANRIEFTIYKPIRQFIDKHYADIIAINKQYRKEDGEDTNCNVLKNLNLSQKNRRALESLQRLFEDGANKYPRLIHLVLEWPLFRCMPKPPREMLSFCDQQEYDRMLERRKKDCFNSVGGFSGIETQSTYWFLYPKGESWNKDSGIKRFQDLLIDTHNLLGCGWLKLLHEHANLMTPWHVHCEFWDGLFDDDYELDEESLKKGLYKNYYITDVFYESIRLCKKLLELETGKQEDTTKIEDRQTMSKFNSKDEELFLKIASDVISSPEKYLEAGKWLDRYYDNGLCTEKQKEVELQKHQLLKEIDVIESEIKPEKLNKNSVLNEKLPKLEGKLFTKKYRFEFLSQFETKQRPPIKEQLAYALEDLFKDYQHAGVLSEQDARAVLLIVWVATDAKTNEMKPSITKFANVPWKIKAEVSDESRFGLASFLFLDLDIALHYESTYKPNGGLCDNPLYELHLNYLQMIHRSWAKIKADKEVGAEQVKHPYLSMTDLIKHFKIHKSQEGIFRKKIERARSKNTYGDGFFREIANPRVNEPKYEYKTEKVALVVEEMKRSNVQRVSNEKKSDTK